MIRFHRIKQVAHYGWQHAGQISDEAFGGKRRLSLFFDIFGCYRKYGMWSNQYLKERMWEKDKSNRATVGNAYKEANLKREKWLKDFYANRKFFIKYGNIKYEKESLRAKRNEAYTKRYNAGKNLFVENDVNISRQHYLDGTISVGDNVLLAKHVFIDYSGEVILSDDVKISAGVIIESHVHDFKPDISGTESDAKSSRIIIENGVWIAAGATICETCNVIGRFSQIGAGSVIRNNIPPYSLVIGNPAKIVGFLLSPEEVKDFETKYYPQLVPTDMTKYESDYKKYFISKLKEIKQYTKL